MSIAHNASPYIVFCFHCRQSYDVDISLNIPGTNSVSTNSLDLKNPFFRYTGQAPQAMPGTSTQSPTDAYWSSLVTGRFIIWVTMQEKWCSGQTNRLVQSLKKARSCKFWIKVDKELYHLIYSKNKRADQLCRYCTADLHLCFHVGKNLYFSWHSSYEGLFVFA